MALVKAGWWQASWWPGQWWPEDWWLDYGAVAPSPPTPKAGGQLLVRGVPDDLALLALVLISRRRRKRSMIISS